MLEKKKQMFVTRRGIIFLQDKWHSRFTSENYAVNYIWAVRINFACWHFMRGRKLYPTAGVGQ